MHQVWLCLLAVAVSCFVCTDVRAQESPTPPAQAAEGAPVAGEQANTAPPAPSDAELHQGLRGLQATMEKALNARDIDTIIANVDERVVFTTMNGDVVRGHDGIRNYFARMMEGPDKVVESVTSHFEADDLSVLHGKGMAIAFGHTDDHYVLTDGESFDIQARWSGTLLHEGSKWRIASFHYSTNVFDNPVLTMQRNTLLGLSAVAVVVIGLVAFFVGRRLAKRSVA